MKILVYGAGVLGSIYAARLQKGGHQVSILARGRRLDEIREHGLVLEDSTTGEKMTAQIDTLETLGENDHYDLVIVYMRRNQALQLLPTLSKNRATQTFLFMGNNAGGHREYAEALGTGRVLMGFGGTGGVREGHTVRLLKGALTGDIPITIGEPDGRITPRLNQIREAFQQAGIKTSFETDIDAYLKTHAALVTPMVLAVYSAGGDNYRLARTRDGLVTMVRAIREEFRTLDRLGIPVHPTKIRLLSLLPEPALVWLAKQLFGNELSEIGIAGHANVARDEFSHLADELKSLSQNAGTDTPCFHRLCAFTDPSTPPLEDGSSSISLSWTGVLTALAAIIALASIWWLAR